MIKTALAEFGSLGHEAVTTAPGDLRPHFGLHGYLYLHMYTHIILRKTLFLNPLMISHFPVIKSNSLAFFKTVYMT